MTRTTLHLLAGAAFLGLAGVAQAADMGGPYRAPSVVQPLPEAAASGWYLRGDVGVGVTSSGDWTDGYMDVWNTGPSPAGPAGWNSHRLGETGTIGVGVGYQFNDFLRGDLTAQYRGYTPVTAIAYNIDNTVTPSDYFEDKIHGGLRSGVFLANLYGDLGNYGGLTPYIGAGIGTAYNHVSAGSIGISSASLGGIGTYAGQGTWNLAWALHTGFAFDISRSLKLDVGYSYTDLGSAKTGDLACTGGGCGAVTYFKGLEIKDLHSHDVHVGLRWMLNPVEPKAYTPVVAKY